ncbi:MAG TPA: hypothetical protein VK919_06025 [Solirubrobacterales bacterium]|nr:hypothetical protein [Solirubrobacterales bacterium]
MSGVRGASKRWLGGGAAALVAVAVAVGVLVAGGGGDDPEPTVRSPAADPEPADRAEPPEPPPGDAPRDERGDADPADEPPVLDEDELGADEREAARTVRAYVNRLSARDGAAVCALLAPGAIDAVELPEDRGGCARSLSASIGYRDARGLPVWDSARVRGLLTVALDGDRASVTATTVTRFADRDEPSIEDDVVHLVRDDDRWKIAKASSTLYRAVGIADVPPRVLAPPG